MGKTITYTVKVDEYGTQYWYKSSKRHREGGPAIEFANGDKHWYINGKRHREGGPAIEYADGAKFWYKNGELHREDGPAIELAGGYKAWYINGKELTEAEFNASKQTCDGKTVEIEGKKYKLVAV